MLTELPCLVHVKLPDCAAHLEGRFWAVNPQPATAPLSFAAHFRGLWPGAGSGLVFFQHWGISVRAQYSEKRTPLICNLPGQSTNMRV